MKFDQFGRRCVVGLPISKKPQLWVVGRPPPFFAKQILEGELEEFAKPQTI